MGNKVICVLGMHRSGTSCLTGTLEQAGVFPGLHLRKMLPHEEKFNRKGMRENQRIVRLHQGILRSNGGNWDCPPLKLTWLERHKAERDSIIAEYDGCDCWGFKDPRTLLTLDGWLEALPDLRLVGIFRHPLSVSDSLRRRDNFTLEEGVNLWTYYNLKLLGYHRRFEFPLICFDESPDKLKSVFLKVLRSLDLPSDGDRLTFFEEDLRSASHPDSDMPAEAREVYEELRSRALHG